MLKHQEDLQLQLRESSKKYADVIIQKKIVQDELLKVEKSKTNAMEDMRQILADISEALTGEKDQHVDILSEILIMRNQKVELLLKCEELGKEVAELQKTLDSKSESFTSQLKTMEEAIAANESKRISEQESMTQQHLEKEKSLDDEIIDLNGKVQSLKD